MQQEVQERFKEAFERYSDELFRHCVLRLSNRDRARELTQEAFLRTWEYVRRGQEVREFRPFLYQTLKHLIIDEYRKRKTISLDAMVTDHEDSTIESLVPVDESEPMAQAVDRFDASRAVAALSLLPDSYREVLLFRYINSLSPKEIAEIIGESENVVSVRIHRGLKKLRVLLEEPEHNERKKVQIQHGQ